MQCHLANNKKISEINWRTYYPQLKLLCKVHIRGTSSAEDSQLAPIIIIISRNQAANPALKPYPLAALKPYPLVTKKSVNDSYDCCIFLFNCQYLKLFSSYNQYSTK